MKITSYISLFIIVIMLLAPNRLFAATFGITPSVLDTQVDRGDVLYGFVSIVRANPKDDTYILVSTRDDQTGAIQLTSGERFLLPIGEYDVRYTFAVDTSKLTGTDRFEAGIEFINEDSEEREGLTDVILGNVMKVGVTIRDEYSDNSDVSQDAVLAIQEEQENGSEEPKDFTFGGSDVFLLLAVAVLFVSFALLRTRRKGKSMSGRLFLLSAITFFVAILGWAYTSGRIPIHRWIDVWSMNISVFSDGAYFLLRSPDESDTFLSPVTGQSQQMDGDWLYVATSTDRVYVIPASVETLDAYEQRLFRFYESGIKPFEMDTIPGIVSFVYENRFGTYAIFVGDRPEEGEKFWCVAEVWESSEIVCDLLDQQLKEEIQAVWFSDTQPNLILIQTSEAVYEYDVWRKTFKNLEESLEYTADSFEFPRPMETSGVEARFGLIYLDQVWMLAPFGAKYYPFSASLWLERVSTKQKDQIFLVDTRTFHRLFITEVSSDETLYYLQKGGFSTSP